MFSQKKSILFSLLIVLAFFVSGRIFAQHDMSMHGMHKDNKTMDMQKSVTMEKDSTDKNSIVREGVIDLKKIDVNKDGKVFQDQMDWNVISDKPGKCPLCKMTLKEVSLKDAKAKLRENGFKVK